MPIETFPWDSVDHLDSEQAVEAYLQEVTRDGDRGEIALAHKTAERARLRLLCRDAAQTLQPYADQLPELNALVARLTDAAAGRLKGGE